MNERLSGKRIAILVANEGIEQVELTEPRKALEEEGATTELVAPQAGTAHAVNHLDKGDTFPVDLTLAEADPDAYDGLLLPGGVANPDALRLDDRAVSFARAFVAAGKPVAAICHAPWVLVEADVLGGRTLTSWPSLRTDIRNAGGTWVDEEVVIDGALVTSRKPDDLPAFSATMIEAFAAGRHPVRA
jgi:protease I